MHMTISRLLLGLVILLFIGVPSASATIQSQINAASDGYTVTVALGSYPENVVVNKSITLVGNNNPLVTATSSDIFNVTVANVTITGFTIYGNSAGSGIKITNSSPGTCRFIYNNIHNNSVGVNNTIGTSTTANAEYCYWGDEGTGADKGKPGAGTSTNNYIAGSVDYTPWVTEKVTNGRISNSSPLSNTLAGVVVTLSGGSGSNYLVGSAEYINMSAPYNSSSRPGTVVKCVDAFVSGYTGGSAAVRIEYDTSEIASVIEATLTPYLWTGSTWVQASSITRSPSLNLVSGSFLVSTLTGAPIALVGDDYDVTILPVEAPGSAITTKPVFTTFTIESALTDIDDVYYQIDNHTNTSGWTVIQSNFGADTWNWPRWSMTDSEWASLGNGTHTIYIKFTRTGGGSTIGADGSVSWQFFKTASDPADTYVTVVQPNGGETLTRDPYTITWTLTSTTSLDYITLYYSRDGGTTYPYRVARIGNSSSSLTSYIWRSPNIYANQAKIKVVARYLDGTEYSDTSDANFNITKGYSFYSYRPGAGYTSFRSWGRPGYSFRAG